MVESKHRAIRRRGVATGLVAGLGLGLWGGVQLAEVRASPPPEAPAEHSRYQKLDPFARALALVEQHYVRPVDGDRLVEAALYGMVAELDPHTDFLSEREARVLMEDIDGRFGGVGLVVTLERVATREASDTATGAVDGDAASDTASAQPDSGDEAPASEALELEDTDQGRLVLVVNDVIPGGPADGAGVRIGDYITAVNGKPVGNYVDLRDAILDMRGREGTKVSFTFEHPGSPEQNVNVIRAIIQAPAVQRTYLGDGIGVLRLRDFQETSTREVREGLQALEKEAGAPLRGVVLDLRDNGGGLLSEAIGVVDLFVARGPIVRTRGRGGAVQDEAFARSPGTFRKVPLVVLQNKGSASASEIVAGALQDHRRALIIGERSYGKGSVQTPYRLGDGSILKLTTALYYTPDDRLIQAAGITPDVLAGMEPPSREDSRPDLPTERDAEGHLEPEDFGRETLDDTISPAERAAGRDGQLIVAVQHLVGLDRMSQGRRR